MGSHRDGHDWSDLAVAAAILGHQEITAMGYKNMEKTAHRQEKSDLKRIRTGTNLTDPF